MLLTISQGLEEERGFFPAALGYASKNGRSISGSVLSYQEACFQQEIAGGFAAEGTAFILLQR